MGESLSYHPPDEGKLRVETPKKATFGKRGPGKGEIAAVLAAAALAGGAARAETKDPFAELDEAAQELQGFRAKEKAERKKGIEDRIKKLSALDPQKYTAEKVGKLLQAFQELYAQDPDKAESSFDANLKKIEEKFQSQQPAKSPYDSVGEKAAMAHQEMESGLKGFEAFFDADTKFHDAIDALRKIINPGEATEYNGIRFTCLKDGTITSEFGKLTPEVRKKLMDKKALMDEIKTRMFGSR